MVSLRLAAGVSRCPLAPELCVQVQGTGALQQGWGMCGLAAVQSGLGCNLDPPLCSCAALGFKLWFAHRWDGDGTSRGSGPDWALPKGQLAAELPR